MILIVHILYQQISFAKNRSDAVVKKLDAEHFDQHKSARAENKSTFFPPREPLPGMTHIMSGRANPVYQSDQEEIQGEAYGSRKCVHVVLLSRTTY